VLAASMSWVPLVDTALPTGRVDDGRLYEPGEVYRLKARSFALFIDRSQRSESARAGALAAPPSGSGVA
jgi:hypothetical protein